MTKRQCLKALKAQKSKLKESFDFSEYSIWYGQTLHYLEDAFDKESHPYQAIKKFRPIDVQYGSTASYLQIKGNLDKLFDTFIELVKNNSYKKQPKHNFLSKLDNGILTTILLAIASALGGGCFLLGQYTSDVKNFELTEQNKSLKDSIAFYKKTDSINMITHNKHIH